MAYAFTLQSHWRIPATVAEVVAILSDIPRLADWWGAVYLSAEVLAPGDPDTGVGRVVAFHSRGRLPYTLRWQGEVVARSEGGWTLHASGDLEGRGEWAFAQDGGIADIRYTWQVDVTKPVLRALLPLLRPAYRANHRWAMAQGEAGLRQEVARRRAAVTAPP